MERREPGRAKTTPTHRQLLFWTIGYTLAAFALLSMQRDASAANLVDVRVGEHRGYTRIVLELDSLAAYQVSEPRDEEDAVMRIELDARGGAREIAVPDAVVSAVRVEPNGKNTSIHVDFAKAAVQINEMILLAPPRLVFDIRDPAQVAALGKPSKKPAKPVAEIAVEPKTPKATAPSRSVEKPAAEKAAEQSERPVVAKATPAPAVEAAAATAKPGTSAGGPAKSADTAERPGKPDDLVELPAIANDPATAAAGAAPAPGTPANADTTSLGAAMGDAAAGKAPGHPLPVGGANAGRPNSLAIPPPPNTVANAVPGASSNKLAVPPLPSQRNQARGGEATAEDKPGGLLEKARGMIAGLNKMVLGGIGVFVVLLLFFVIRKGRGSDDALSPVMSANDLGGEGDDLFSGPQVTEREMEPTEPIPTDRSKPAPVAPAAAGSSGALETRVAQLEGALAQLTQSRENMERQLAAQTEELRVQRAAIARTQRVVRSIGDGEEEHGGATEPVPRAPAS